jgi:hypothetical protein
MEEIRNVTWGLWGEELEHWQSIQRLVLGGFQDPRVLLNMFAIIEGESGEYTRAWHANVVRNADGTIQRDDQERMTVKSIDLGFCQFNVVLPAPLKMAMTEDAMRPFVEGMFNANPDYARADTSAAKAHELYLRRGFQPWYAYKPGTEAFKLKKRYGAKAIAEYLIRTQVGKVDGKFPRLEWVN